MAVRTRFCRLLLSGTAVLILILIYSHTTKDFIKKSKQNFPNHVSVGDTVYAPINKTYNYPTDEVMTVNNVNFNTNYQSIDEDLKTVELELRKLVNEQNNIETTGNETDSSKRDVMDDYVIKQELESNIKDPSDAMNANYGEVTHNDYLKVVNPHNFSYLNHPGNICDEDLFLLLYLHTSPENFQRRALVRNTWGNQTYYSDFKIKVLFVLGKTDDKKVQETLDAEEEQYRDILQEDYKDSYKNLTYKGISALKYISENCQHVPYILKTDDDIFVNMYPIVRKLKEPRMKKFLMCLKWKGNMPVLRDPKSKWYVSKDEYKADMFVPYCSGCAYIMSSETAVSLHNASYYVNFFWVDDVHITGTLAKEAKVPFIDISQHYVLDFQEFQNKFHTNITSAIKECYFSHHGRPESMKALWEAISYRVRDKETFY